MEHMKAAAETAGITVVDTHYHRPHFAASYLLTGDGSAAFIDVGTTRSQQYLLHALHGQGLGPADVSHIVLTHIHLDHAGGAGDLLQLCPNACVIVHPQGAPHLVDPAKLISASIAIYGEQLFDQLYGTITPVAAERLLSLADGERLDVAGRCLHFFDTPGHARHHYCIWDPGSRSIFTGDTLGLAYPELQKPGRRPFLIPTTSPAAFEPEALQASINRVLALKPATLYPTHFGGVPADPDSIHSLLSQIGKHAACGQASSDLDEAELQEKIGDIFYRAWCDYTDDTPDKAWLLDLLAADIELNAQGVKIWAQRQRRRQG